MKRASPKLIATLQALLVTFLWSTSFILVRFGLEDIPALTFAGLRYFLAFLCLLPLGLVRKRRAALRALLRGFWGKLLLLGLLQYAVTQGGVFLALSYLPGSMVSLIFNLVTVVVALTSMRLLHEPITSLQWVALGVFFGGVGVFFLPLTLRPEQMPGLGVMLVTVCAASAGSLLGRAINRAKTLDAITITTISMGIGGTLLLGSGVLVQGLPPISLRSVAIIAWLAVVNTAFAFTLWNQSLRTLPAIESNSINNLMLFEVALLEWLILGMTLNGRQILGMLMAAVGGLGVQLRDLSRLWGDQGRRSQSMASASSVKTRERS